MLSVRPLLLYPSRCATAKLTNTLPTANSTIQIPFPTHRLASTALRALSVDEELSPLVRRSFSLASSNTSPTDAAANEQDNNILVTHYTASTNRMLRVATNGFFESVGVVLACMRELDVDVAEEEWVGEGNAEVDELRRVQGLEERGVIGR